MECNQLQIICGWDGNTLLEEADECNSKTSESRKKSTCESHIFIF